MKTNLLFPKAAVIIFCACFSIQKSVIAQSGNLLYGVTTSGGNGGQGTIFHIDPNTGIHTIDHSIKGSGVNPRADLTEGGNGKFYGMTPEGGAKGGGVIFEWDPSTNLYTEKIDLDSTMGCIPFGSLTLFNGKFYAMTTSGGTNNMGVIFEWDPATNYYTKKLDFDGATRGSKPEGTLTLWSGRFYGMTKLGGANNEGVIFEWDPSTNAFNKKVDFDSTAKGACPHGALTFKEGKFYGMTEIGGSNNDGVIFEWDPTTNVFVKKVDFDNIVKGRYPYGSLTLSGESFFGMTVHGGIYWDAGVIFEWIPASNTFTKKVDIKYIISNPYGSLILKDGKFYGMTANEPDDFGNVFEWDPSTNIFTTKSTSPGRPFGSLTLSGGKFYGMACGATHIFTNTLGFIFEWDPSVNILTKKHNFDLWVEGTGPFGILAQNNGKFYGMNFYHGGMWNEGWNIVEWDPINKTYTKKTQPFTNEWGISELLGSMTYYDGKFYCPYTLPGSFIIWDTTYTNVTFEGGIGTRSGQGSHGSLTLVDGKFYGMSDRYGGANDAGFIFEWDLITNIYTEKISFESTSRGRNFNNYKSLTFNNGKFYGMTYSGGVNDLGIIFEWDTASNILSNKIDFDGVAKGSYPEGSLTCNNGKFYGMTTYGGINDMGVIFEWDPVTNIYTKKIDFDGTAKGRNPTGSLALSNGKFYGTADYGGANNMGVIFEWDPVTNVFNKLLDFNGLNGANPSHTTLIEHQAPVVTGKTIQLHSVFPEGLYNFSGTLRKAHDQAGEHFQGTIADQITVELHDSANYALTTCIVNNVNLSTTGSATFTIPANLGSAYYLTIKHRNSIETTSAVPISFASDTVSYSFNAPSMVFGGNLHQTPDGYWVIYGGDANQDDCVDSRDLIMVDNSSAMFVAGYVAEDANGDGFINATDQVMIGKNAAAFVCAKTPQ